MLAELADRLAAIRLPHPLRVGIDGVTAAGKTVLADELVTPLTERGRPVIRAGLDGFHNPSGQRYRRGRDCPVGYYEDSFNYAAIVRCVLAPLGPGGNRRYRPTAFDYHADSPVETEPREADPEAILLFEGVMLFRPELDPHWDYRIYVDVDFETGLARAQVRDRASMGCPDTIRRRHVKRFRPGQQAYLDAHRPRERAQAVIENHRPDQPVLDFREPHV